MSAWALPLAPYTPSLLHRFPCFKRHDSGTSATLTYADDIHAQRFKLAESSITRHLKKAPKSQTALVARFVLQHEQRSPTTSVLQALAVVRRQGELSPANLWRVERALKEMRRCESWGRDEDLKGEL